MSRRLVAALACRAASSRLYAKPLQNIAPGKKILDQIIDAFEALGFVDASVLGICEGIENLGFVDYAAKRGVPYIVGSSADILSRLIQCGLYGQATDVLRVTSECPFVWWEMMEEAWRRHVESGNDVTATDGCPLGTYFEYIRMDAFLEVHAKADAEEKEHCTAYFRHHPDEYKVEVITPPAPLSRLDIRLTVDNPEDLVVCKAIFAELQVDAPLIPLGKIIDAWDRHPEYAALLAPYNEKKGIWV